MSKNLKATSAPKFIQLQPFDTATQIINSFTIPVHIPAHREQLFRLNVNTYSVST